MTIIRDTFPIRDREATPTKPPTRDDGVHGERSDQTADGPEPVAAEHTDALALANTSQKAPPDHREDLVQGDVQRYGPRSPRMLRLSYPLDRNVVLRSTTRKDVPRRLPSWASVVEVSK